jgi:hypothetical protein
MLAATRAAATADKDSRARVGGIAGFYRAMSLFQQGKQAEAAALFTATAAAMKPIPADERKPAGANQDDLILWMACKEAKALLNASTPAR